MIEENVRDIAVAVQYDNKNVSVIDTIHSIKKAGFKNVFLQWYDKDWEYSQEEQVELCKNLDLNIIFAHLGYQNINSIWVEGQEGDGLVERYKKNIKECKDNNIPMVVMHLTSKTNAQRYNEIGLNRLKEIVKYAKDLDIKVAFENTKIKGYLEYVLDNIKDENVGICFDAGHCHAHFDDEFDFKFFKDRIFAVHLHDNDKTEDLHLMPFDGTIDWKSYIRNLNKSNYDGPITLELCYRYDYLNMSLDDFYKQGYDIANKLVKMFEEIK